MCEETKTELLIPGARADLIQQLTFIEQLQDLVIAKLREAKDRGKSDHYLGHDLDDVIATLGRESKAMAEIVEGLQGDSYHY